MILSKGDNFKESFIVTDDVYNGFIHVFGDRNPLHTDEQFAIGKGFSGKVMHGNILNGFLSYFVGECLPSKDVIIHGQEIKFPNPVYMNDRLAFEAVVSEISEAVGVAIIKFKFRNIFGKIVAKGEIQIGML
ncbi:MAG: MaoC/PaaZ C-terminal domain-containing protein [Flavipsychrobacter sp.]|nr:MaoC/PaaZ C-terminal domain-containing protein [Flavipsychrobacter sp.]